MLVLIISILIPLVPSIQSLNHPYPPIPCSLTHPHCPPDTTCILDTPSCTDPANNCPGLCLFRNAYQLCGGFAIEPILCYTPGQICADDPRSPQSCGMACDGPGICLCERLDGCVCDDDCGEGRWCYGYQGETCEMHGERCEGVCL